MAEPKKDSLTKMSEALGTTFESQDLIVRKEEPVAVAVNLEEEEKVFLDQDYIRNNIKDLIKSSKMVMEKLEQDIMLGSSPRLHEVYATLLTSVTNAHKELAELNKNVVDVKFKKEKANAVGKGAGGGFSGKDKTIPLTAAQLSEMLQSARDNSTMNNIKVDFKVSEEDK